MIQTNRHSFYIPTGRISSLFWSIVVSNPNQSCYFVFSFNRNDESTNFEPGISTSTCEYILFLLLKLNIRTSFSSFFWNLFNSINFFLPTESQSFKGILSISAFAKVILFTVGWFWKISILVRFGSIECNKPCDVAYSLAWNFFQFY